MKNTFTNDTTQRINRAKELLRTAKHGAIATVNEDGTPHNSPLYLIIDDELKHFYFASHPESLHAQNVVRTGQLFAVVYDMRQSGGLYLRAVNGHELHGDEYERAMIVHNQRRTRDGKQPIPPGDYQLRLYGADIDALWVNTVERNKQGWVARDYREEVPREELVRPDDA